MQEAPRAALARHRPAEPLYTRDYDERSLAQLRPVAFSESFDVAAGVSGSFTRAGRIVGSTCLALRAGAVTITFSGDVGRPNDPIREPPAPLGATDHLVMDSPYGDRERWSARRARGPVMRGVATHRMVRQYLLHSHALGDET